MIRLHRAIEFGVIGVDLALAGSPWGLPALESLAALDSLIEYGGRMIDLRLGDHELGIFQEKTAGFGVNLDIAHERGIGMLRSQIPDNGFDLFALVLYVGEILRLRLRRRGTTASSASAAGRSSRRCLSRGLLAGTQTYRADEEPKKGDSLHGEDSIPSPSQNSAIPLG